MELCIIIEINVCGLINVVEMLFCVLWNLVIPIIPWVLGTLLSNVECSPLPFYIFLDADITPKDPHVGQGGLQDAPGAA